MALLEQIGQVGGDPAIKAWAGEKSVVYKEKIAEERSNEEKRDRERHERFED